MHSNTHTLVHVCTEGPSVMVFWHKARGSSSQNQQSPAEEGQTERPIQDRRCLGDWGAWNWWLWWREGRGSTASSPPPCQKQQADLLIFKYILVQWRARTGSSQGEGEEREADLEDGRGPFRILSQGEESQAGSDRFLMSIDSGPRTPGFNTRLEIC